MPKKTAAATTNAGAPATNPTITPAVMELLVKCTRRERAFILVLMKDPERNQRRAYEAVYKARGGSADSNASRLLKKDQVKAAYGALVKQLVEDEIVDARLVLREMLLLATTDLRSFFDAHGNLKPVQQLSEAQGRQLASMEVIIKNAAAGDGVTDTVHKFKVWDKVKALEMLAKHKALFAEPVQHVEHDVEMTIKWED